MIEQLLIIVPGFPSDEADTSCLPPVQAYVRALARLHPEIDLRVLALQYPFANGTYRWHGIEVETAGGSNRGGVGKAATWLRAWRTISRHRPSLVHSFWIGECTLLGACASYRYGSSHVASIGGQELRRRSIYARLLRRMPFTLAAPSHHAARSAHDTLGRRADAIIPLGLDLCDLPAGSHADHPTASTDEKRSIDVLAVGSLIPVKRVQDVLAVARGLPEARFVIVGDGPLAATLKRAAPRNVTFAGSLRREDVLDLMAKSRVLLHSSEYESQGYVFLEALASGMHVVCRDVGFAGDSEDVHRCDSLEEMTRIVRRLLGRPPPARVAVPTAEDSVSAYLNLYQTSVTDFSARPRNPEATL